MDMSCKICGNCKHHVHDSVTDWICDNDQSAYFADVTPFTHSCDDFEEKEGARQYDWRTTGDKTATAGEVNG